MAPFREPTGLDLRLEEIAIVVQDQVVALVNTKRKQDPIAALDQLGEARLPRSDAQHRRDDW